ncbi:MAG: ribosome biogenesis GTP-binding protein YihA/YsxC [Clostridia bacterium]|nr:ribosome biogenesis GTP-binding protein YihA/YsxC [Clostridia bacterium]
MIKNAEYEIGIFDLNQEIPNYDNVIAIVGKSNSGKSSFINSICNRKNLAYVGKTPGKTRALIYYKINKGEFYFLDFPGYGYAEVSEKEKKKWGTLIESTLSKGIKIKHAFILIDHRRTPSEDDIMMQRYFVYHNIPFTIIATKADKSSKSVLNNRLRLLSNDFFVGKDNIYPYSILDNRYKESIYKRINSILGKDE